MARRDLAAGTKLPTRTFGPLTRADFVRYREASGDPDSADHDDDPDRVGGLARVLGAGMVQAGLLATYCTDLLGPRSVRRFKVRFHEQVGPGDTLTAAAIITDVYEAGEEPRIDIELTMTRGASEVAITGMATFATDELGDDY